MHTDTFAMKKRNALIVIAFILLAGLQLSTSARATPAPAFTLPEIHSMESLSLADYQGKVIYLDFWASWCGPCRKSLPLMNEVYKRLEDKGFMVIAINLDENRELGLKFLENQPLDYPIVFDKTKSVPGKYQLEAMPSAYLIDKKGTIRAIHKGFKEKDLSKIETQITFLLDE
ncbi:TlpA family protein disulfide reductase [Saccharophagus degradans]|uniref:Thioredoxin-like protein n=1 Tax=Saccharophagus degradans (strain 2-40 / ATCC 43961 / DSM 17024) TaxID=203122 RepID=Q21KF1_SACD2|nr:TlpA disulfide reductase family protein [Saccharophagus degradans]ABD80828.1 Thioredoxin-like protein [Saccharophagus degradans 2-40]